MRKLKGNASGTHVLIMANRVKTAANCDRLALEAIEPAKRDAPCHAASFQSGALPTTG